MTKGRKPIPTALKELRGTDQPCRVNHNEVKVDALQKLPSSPRWFTPTQKKIYKTKGEQLKSLRVLTPLDIELFISFCREYGNYIDTSSELEQIPLKDAMTEKQEKVYKRLMKINRESWERSKSLAAEFGFTPSARAKIVTPKSEDPTENDFA